jgi:hypothetical protein
MSLGTKRKADIVKHGNRIAQLFNESEILDIPIVFYVLGETSNELFVRFALSETTYSGAGYSIAQDGYYAGHMVASGIGVNSDIGNRTGTLLFHLTLLLAISLNVSVFYLDNFTDDPGRAAQGIYSLFQVDKTKERHGTDRKEFVGLNLEDQIHLAEGSMRLIIDASTYRRWKAKMILLAEKSETSGSPWHPNVTQKMKGFLRFLDQKSLSGGKKLRFSPKTTKKMGKKHKKTKVKKGNSKTKKRKSKN